MESSLEGNGGDLMDQCSWHDTPPAFSVNLTNWLGHDLDIGLSALESRVLTSQWLGGKNAPFEANLPVPLGRDTQSRPDEQVDQARHSQADDDRPVPSTHGRRTIASREDDA